MRSFARQHLRRAVLVAAASMLVIAVPSALGAHATDGIDVKVTLDNNNVDGGTPNPSFDAQNRQSNETTTVISPANPNIVAAGANDYRMVTVAGDVWLGVYVSSDGGASWFNTMVPGFTTDTSAAGLASPLRGLDASGDPVVRFDAAGNLYVAAIAFNRDFDQPDRPVDNLVYVAKYNYTPGTPGGTSTPSSAANPPNFTYTRTTVVDRGAVGFAVPGVAGFAGTFTDKEWMEVDTNAPSSSPCAGNVYVTHTNFHALGLLADRVQLVLGRWSHVHGAEDDLHRRSGWNAEQPGLRHRRRAGRHRLRRLQRLRAEHRREHDQPREVDRLRRQVEPARRRRHAHGWTGSRSRVPHADVRLRRR
ncbi:MAG: hypothetical protein ACRDPZ_07810 [Gaiellaceae bacterium]